MAYFSCSLDRLWRSCSLYTFRNLNFRGNATSHRTSQPSLLKFPSPLSDWKVPTPTKFRIVFGCSARKNGRNSKCVNDNLHVSPTLSPLLFDILLKFRQHKEAFVADIEKALLKIEVNEKDKNSLRFLWVKKAHKGNISAVTCRFCRVIFGTTYSKYLLQH